MNRWLSQVSRIACMTSSSIDTNCAFRSNNGTSTDGGRRYCGLADIEVSLAEFRDHVFDFLVAPRAGCTGADALSRWSSKLDAAVTYPASYPRRAAIDHGVIGYVAGHDGTRPDEAITAQSHTTNDGRIRTDARTALNQGRGVFILARHMGTRIDHVGEDTGGTTENVVLQHDAGIDRHIVLDFYIVTDGATRRYHHVLPDVAGLTQGASAHDVTKMPNLGAGANIAGLVDIARLVYKKIRFHVMPP